jgi:hypothetical protein
VLLMMAFLDHVGFHNFILEEIHGLEFLPAFVFYSSFVCLIIEIGWTLL